MITTAFEKASMLGVLNNSITHGQGNAAGYLGEEAVAAYLGGKIVSSEEGVQKYNHDLLLYDRRFPQGLRAEVKTKRRTVEPQEHYEVSVAQTSLHQKPDIYIFVSLQFKTKLNFTDGVKYKDLQAVWLLGQKTPEDFLEQASKWNTGDIDQSNNFVTKTPMYNLAIKYLDTVEGGF
tara:strand:- start:9616 stop:10146 length:531 start_codon:yes stop_codon:yes gene_type:complete